MKQSLQEQIRSDFEDLILSGALVPGERLPIEQELMQRYGCSRMTVNKALSSLATAGLIERRKRAGTFVSRPRVHSMTLEIPDLAHAVRDRGQRYRFIVLNRRIRKPSASSTNEVDLAGNGKILQIDGLHLADEIPFALEKRLISTAAVPDIVKVDFAVSPPGTWLLRHVPWTQAEARIYALAVLSVEAQHLQLEPGSPCLGLERQTWRGGERLTEVRQLFPSEQYDLVAHFGS